MDDQRAIADLRKLASATDTLLVFRAFPAVVFCLIHLSFCFTFTLANPASQYPPLSPLYSFLHFLFLFYGFVGGKVKAFFDKWCRMTVKLY